MPDITDTPDLVQDTVADATVVITDEQLETIVEIAIELQHGRQTAEGIALVQMCTAALLQELVQRRRAMATIQRLAQVDNVFELFRPDQPRRGA